MKITFLSFYSGHVERGAEVFVHELARRLGEGHDVTLVQSGLAVTREVPYKTKVVPFTIDWTVRDQRVSIKRRLFMDYWSKLVTNFARKALPQVEEADVVVPVDGGWEGLSTRWWALRTGAKVVITGHSGMGWDDRINLLSRPDVFVALSEHQARWARRNGFGVKVVTISNGVDLEAFGKIVKRVRVDLPRPIILCVGAMEPNKRIDLAVKAVSKMKEGSLVVVGDGESRSEIVALGYKLLPRRFKHLGRVGHSDMPGFYASVDLFTLPTVSWEPFGLVYLEAMASGLPVVAPDDPIRREIVGDAGLFVDPRNSDEYAEALETALAAKWGNKPREQASKFSWDKVAEQYERLFLDLVRK